MTSELSGFYRLSMRDRRARVAQVIGAREDDLASLSPDRGLAEVQADRMVENALGVLGMPLGLCVNMRIALDGEAARDVLAPMAVEEPSVIAAASYASKLLRAGGGVRASVSEPVMIGQIQVLEVPDPEVAERAVRAAKDELIASANSGHPSLIAAGGGARDVEVRHLAQLGEDDPCGAMMVVHLVVDVRDAMGANAINTMCERLAPRVAELTGGRVALRILSNLTDRRTVTVEGRVPFAALEGQGASSGEALARAIEEASVFAERCPWRAATHNKGIMNGVDAVLLALGQDWRAVEAGAHAFAAKDGRYTAMARWRVENGALVGRMTLPMAVGTVGGVIRVHPQVQINRRIAKIERAPELAAIVAAAGLAQNLGALRALAAEGIQSGHMRLHARNVAVEAGATSSEVEQVANTIADRREVNLRAAKEALAALRARPIAKVEPITIATPTTTRPARRPPTPPMPESARASMSSGESTSGENSMTSSDSVTQKRYERQPHRELGGKVFVTGAAGHLGANLVRRLLEEGRDVRVLLRNGSHNEAIDGLPVEKVYGDLRDGKRLVELMRGCQTAYHAAAQVSTVVATPELERDIFECNVLGTRNLLRAAMDNHYERVVVTGSFSAVGYDPQDPQRPGNEDDVFYPFDDVLPYARTKVQVEHEVLKACVEGLDALVATSCAILGPNDYKPSRMGLTLVDYANGRLRAYPPGGFDFVAARDICEGHVLAMHRGRRGQKYIISTQFATVDDLMDIFEEVSGRPRPRLRIPGPVMQGIAAVSQVALDTFAPSTPRRFTPAAIRILRAQRHADTTKARVELGFEPTSIRTAIHEAYADFARRGLVPARPGTVGVAESAARKSPPSRAATDSAASESNRAATGS
ncbi:hydroxymethylglutaryl-CoA reductase, degradative [Sandaracinus amylolyticus]|uniref:hydroxymethylglutaryl-CoA reductase, degradative n=1 Tax=Sandaracinus amylolyticus TaxID=927083 RepID=UPI001F210D1C|nr:hydroxymethylglutaryl-CoA reductase, degradative [Sandaracinus amylolyticus]UJR78353.1 3-hydroxy-3-methylglutaryl coenzyme A reductase [Sandaracinus amylolyticus]